MSAQFRRDRVEQDYTQFAALILCDDSTGCDEICDQFAIDADIMIDIVCEVDLNEDWFWIFIFKRNIHFIVSFIIFYLYLHVF